MSAIKNRSEILFLYDVKDTNPNGDPLDENKPRIDEATGINVVTDVRLKRTIRDYLSEYKGKDVFVKENKDNDGNLLTKDHKLKDLGIKSAEDAEKLFKKFIDLRLFGATIAVKKGSVIRTGPVQFRFGRSLHQVEPLLIQGTTVMPSGEEKTQGTFTEVYVLPYSLISFYGIVNENAGGYTGLQAEDVDLLLEGIWNGTKNLITRSKVGQMPRLLLHVEYMGGGFHIGDLDKAISVQPIKESGLAIRSMADLNLDFSELKEKLAANKANIKRLRIAKDEALELDLSDLGIKTEMLGY